jgi:hypothetical protein
MMRATRSTCRTFHLEAPERFASLNSRFFKAEWMLALLIATLVASDDFIEAYAVNGATHGATHGTIHGTTHGTAHDDIDDFVPYQGEKFNGFDWNFFKVTLSPAPPSPHITSRALNLRSSYRVWRRTIMEICWYLRYP